MLDRWIRRQTTEQIATVIIQSGLDPLKRVDLDLPDTLACETNDGPDLLQGQWRLSGQSEAKLENPCFSRAEGVDHLHDRLDLLILFASFEGKLMTAILENVGIVQWLSIFATR